MSQLTYKAFCDRMITRYEGGYGWNKKDPGGPTKYGITCFDLAEHRGQKMDSMERWAPLVKAMTLDEAEAIYATKYAAAIRYNDLPAGVDACLFDYGVNSGIARVFTVLRRLYKLPGGNKMDDALLAKIKGTDPSWLVKTICAERLQFMHAIRGGSAWAEFGKGWGARVADLQTYCLHLATAQGSLAPAAPDLSTVPTPKATNTATTATKPTAGGALTAGTAAHVSGLPLWQTACIVGGIFALGILYEAYQDWKTSAANSKVVFAAA